MDIERFNQQTCAFDTNIVLRSILEIASQNYLFNILTDRLISYGTTQYTDL